MNHRNEEPAGVVVTVDPELGALVPGFLNNRREDLQRIAAAMAEGDYQSLRIIGHNMKGSGGAYGFDHISELGARIEKAALAADVAAAAAATEALESYLGRLDVRYGA